MLVGSELLIHKDCKPRYGYKNFPQVT